MSIKILYRKVTFRFLKMSSLLASSILGIVCGSGCVKNVAVPAYGMQIAAYKISGTVVSSDQNIPIKSLSVSLRDTLINNNADYTKTDSLGKYSLIFSGSGTWELNVKDVDSTENGSFIAKDTIISIPSTENTGHIEKQIDMRLDRMK